MQTPSADTWDRVGAHGSAEYFGTLEGVYRVRSHAQRGCEQFIRPLSRPEIAFSGTGLLLHATLRPGEIEVVR